MADVLIILPHQLFASHLAISTDKKIYLIEHTRFFTDFTFHKKKLMLHRASMCAYFDSFDQRSFDITYIEFHKDFWQTIKKNDIDTFHYIDPADTKIEEEIHAHIDQRSTKLKKHHNDIFIDTQWTVDTLKQQKSFFMASFYKKQRQHLDVLMYRDKPIQGQYSFDEANRKPFENDTAIPKPWTSSHYKYRREASDYIENYFPSNPGTTDDLMYPVTHEEALSSFRNFLHHRFAHFGTYQDSIVKNEAFLFHSLLSPALNIGLISPKYVVEEAVKYGTDNDIGINNIEGFIRQVIGWREYMYGVYHIAGQDQRKSNFFDQKKPLPQSFYDATTGIPPVDTVIKRVTEHAYAHHIERLMVLSNFMLLCDIEPDDIYRWFMELFIDAYDWVMVPNVYGMGQYADGGLICTKPYISSSQYIRKMSNFEKGSWCKVWDGLYWRFIDKHQNKLANNYRMNLIMSIYKRMNNETLENHIKNAEEFLKKL
jgi:deoxyribodipyrimidine photolyase-related protein